MQTAGVFFDPNVEQIKFAAGDVKVALESNDYEVEMLPLTSLDASYANKKVVIALASNESVTKVLTSQSGNMPKNLGEQAYGLRTTVTPQKSYWALGGDVNGAMYGGLQLAENIKFSQFSGTHNNQESPFILKRGIKLNYPLDKGSPTYGKDNKGGFQGISYRKAIPHVWDMTFWTTWFDEMARFRYNVVSIWLCHPFPSLIEMADYPDVAIQDVTGFGGFVKTMTIDQKVDFWKKVMAYAHSRGFEFYFFTWNVFTYGATGKYKISQKASNPKTKTYLYKCMKALLETYPDLDGFGVTNGENKSTEEFLWDTYGQALHDYAVTHPQRKLRFIHRWHFTTLADIKQAFKQLFALPNVMFDMSFKYSQAHMYSTPVPKWGENRHVDELTAHGLKTWYTVRNDDFYYHNWGDPDFARAYINGMPGNATTCMGFYMGSDGFCPTRTFFSKNSVTQGILEVQRQWYMFMLWGRLSYNSQTPDDVFKHYMALKFPGVPSNDLFDAWSKASRSIPKVSELIHGHFFLDFQWWPEACHSGRSKKSSSFVTVDRLMTAVVGPGSSLCSIADSASNKFGVKKSSYQLADEIEADAISALAMVEDMSAPSSTEQGLAVNNIKAMSYISIYYAYKIRGATYKKANKPSNTTTALGQAYCWWMKYSALMDEMYDGMTMQRVDDLPNWHSQDDAVLKEYTSNGGVGIPICEDKLK